MGYYIAIGNVIVKKNEDSGYLHEDSGWIYATADIEEMILDNAPIFQGSFNDKSNSILLPIIHWEQVISWSNLTDLFYDKYSGLFYQEGVHKLNQMHYDEIERSLKYKLSLGIGAPGFVSLNRNCRCHLPGMTPNKYSDVDRACLAYLIWLEFWCKVALETAERPAIMNMP